MTQTSWNMSENEPASDDVRRVLSLLLLALLLLGLRTPVQAADQPLGPFLFTSSSSRNVPDVEIEINVLRALRKDTRLKPLNLGVHMVGGVARLSGPIPSAELKQRAISVAERVEGVLKVDGRDLYISTAAQGTKPLTVVIQDEPPTQTRSASPQLPSNGMESLPHVGGSSVPQATSQQVTLLPPQVAPRLAHIPEAARLTAHPRAKLPTASLSATVEQLRRSQKRFRPIRTQVRGSTVCLFPGDAPTEDAMMFAQALRRLPGVQHVLVASGSR